MLFDLLVFILSVVGLSSQRSESPLKRRLRAQGILYFAVAVIVYIPPAVGPHSPPRTVFSKSSSFRSLLCSLIPVRFNYKFFWYFNDLILIQLYISSFPILVSRLFAVV